MSSNLENRYRRLLRVLPRWYRAEREEEMVGIFLAERDDELDLEYSWPGWGETWATLGLAMRTRFSAGGAPAHAVALGDIVRLVALLGLLAQAALAVGGLTNAVVWPVTDLGLDDPSTLGAVWGVASPLDYLLVFVPMLVCLVALGAAVAMFSGHRGTAKVLITLLVLISLGGHAGFELGWWAVVAQMPLWITAVALFAGFHQEAPPPEPWWRAVAAATVLGAGWALAAVTPLGWLSGLPVWTVVVVGTVQITRRGPAVWSIALAVWALAYLPEQLGSLSVLLEVWDQVGAPVLAVGIVQCAMLVVAVVALAVVGIRDLRGQAAVIP